MMLTLPCALMPLLLNFTLKPTLVRSPISPARSPPQLLLTMYPPPVMNPSRGLETVMTVLSRALSLVLTEADDQRAGADDGAGPRARRDGEGIDPNRSP
jgi:hypothetical protein